MKTSILDFIDSYTLRQQLKGEELPPAIECILISQCKRETLANKLKALQERYDTYSAEEFQKGVYNCVYNTEPKDFKQTLSYYINYKRYLLDEIRDTDENTVFVVENDGYFLKKAYTKLDEAMHNAIVEEFCGPFPIIKHKLNSKDGVLRRVFLTSWGEIADITCFDFTYSEYDLQCAYAEIPHKYKIGDIIEYDGKYAVVADVKINRIKPKYMNHSCHTDMCLFCLRYCEDSLHSCGGSFCHDHFPILETGICSENELPERYRPLIGLSKLFKGEMRTVDFLEMYSNRCLEDLSK